MDSNIKLPKENKAQIEEVRELENETPSFEEFVRDYKIDEKVKDSYQGEFDSYSDIRVDRSYGPGNNRLIDEEDTDKLSRYMSRYLVSKGINTALGPLSLSVGEMLKAASGEENMFQKLMPFPSSLGITVKTFNDENKEKSEFMKWIGDLGKDLAGDWEIGVEEMAHDIASGADSEVAKKFWSIIDKSLEAYGMFKDAEVSIEITKHFSHRGEGTSYDSDCKVCKS